MGRTNEKQNPDQEFDPQMSQTDTDEEKKRRAELDPQEGPSSPGNCRTCLSARSQRSVIFVCVHLCHLWSNLFFFVCGSNSSSVDHLLYLGLARSGRLRHPLARRGGRECPPHRSHTVCLLEEVGDEQEGNPGGAVA